MMWRPILGAVLGEPVFYLFAVIVAVLLIFNLRDTKDSTIRERAMDWSVFAMVVIAWGSIIVNAAGEELQSIKMQELLENNYCVVVDGVFEDRDIDIESFIATHDIVDVDDAAKIVYTKSEYSIKR